MHTNTLVCWAFGLGLLVVGPTGVAQERLALLDAPVVVVDELHRIDEIIDLDGDGNLDVIGAWSSDSQRLDITAWRNDGTGVLTPFAPVQIPILGCTNCSPALLAVGDLNGDHFDDFVVSKESRVRTFLGNGAGGFALWREWNVGYPVDARIADFDGDGLRDIALLVDHIAHVVVYLNRGPDQPFVELEDEEFFGVEHLTVAEVNGDGIADIAVWSASYPRIVTWSAAAGVLTTGPRIEGGVRGMVAAGDLDGDGDDDFVSFGGTTYSIARRTGPSAFTIESTRSGGPATRLADVDGDGDLDGICCSGGGGDGISRNFQVSFFEVSINLGGGEFAPAFLIPGIGSAHIAGAVDLDHDGDVELVAGRCIYWGRGPLVDPSPSFPRSSQARVPGDSDGDGDVDWDVDTSFVLAGLGNGTTIERTPVMPAPPAGWQWGGRISQGDFDLDGDVDMIGWAYAANGDSDYRWLWNRGGYRFDDGGSSGFTPDYGEYVSILYSVVFDLDGDGDLDLTSRCVSLEPGTRIWLNDAGSFVRGQFFRDEYATLAGDFDGDEVVDLVNYRAAGQALLHRGLGGGAFGPAESVFPMAYFPLYRLASRVADMDGDGDLDVVGPDGHAFIHVNDGFGHFTPRLLAPILSAFEYVLVADFDVDGRPDVMLGPGSYTQIGSLVFRAAGPALAFDPPVAQVILGAATADVDGDGDPDVLSEDLDNRGLHSDHAVRSVRFHGASVGGVVQFGAGLPGSGGVKPILGASGPFRTSLSHEIRVIGALGGARTILAVGRTRASIPWRGGTVFVGSLQRTVALPPSGEPGVPGAGRFVIHRAVTPPSFAGRTFVLQAAIRDLGTPHGFALSNGLELRFGD